MAFDNAKVGKYLGSPEDFRRKLMAIIVGDFFCAVAMNFLFVQKGLLSGGIAGIGLMIQFLTGIPSGYSVVVFNIPLVILGYIFLNKNFPTYALISTLALSGYLLIFNKLPNPFIIKDTILVAVAGGILNGIGMGLLFRNGTCQGGLDIVAAIFKKNFNINVGNALLAMNMVIIGVASYIFSLDKGLYTIIAMIVGYRILDRIQIGLGEKKQVLIVTKKDEELANAIMNKIHRGVTMIHGQGAYSKDEKNVLFCVLLSRQIVLLKSLIEDIDPTAFVSISDAYEVKGRGFIGPRL